MTQPLPPPLPVPHRHNAASPPVSSANRAAENTKLWVRLYRSTSLGAGRGAVLSKKFLSLQPACSPRSAASAPLAVPANSATKQPRHKGAPAQSAAHTAAAKHLQSRAGKADHPHHHTARCGAAVRHRFVDTITDIRGRAECAHFAGTYLKPPLAHVCTKLSRHARARLPQMIANHERLYRVRPTQWTRREARGTPAPEPVTTAPWQL